MAKKDSHIDYDLLAKYLAGECTLEEKETIDQLLEENPEIQNIITQGSSLFNAAVSVDNIDKKENFNVDNAWNKVKAKLELPASNQVQIRTKQRFIQLAWKVAAMLVVGISVTLFFYLNKTRQIEFAVASNEIGEFYLPDSSKIVLKDSSRLTAYAHYGDELREVTLTGLGYFDVSENKEKPFIIHASGGDVKVLGTAFAINTKTKNQIVVTVERGSVQLSSSKDPENATIKLGKNESATLLLDDIKITKKEVLSLNSLYWANKKIIYRQQPLVEVFKELEEIFNVTIQYDSATIANCKLSAMFKNENFKTILQHISTSMEFEFEINNNTYYIKSNGCPEN